MSGKVVNWLNAHHMPVKLVIGVMAGIAFAMTASILTHEILHLCGVLPPLHKPLFNTKLVVIQLIYHSFYAVCGAMLTAKIAEEKARKAVLVLGSKEAIMWLIGVLLLWKHTYAWYNLTKAALGIPLAIFGGYLYRKYFKRVPAEGKTKKAV